MAIESVKPDADSAAGSWTDNSGGGTNLFAAIDETTASDTDYVRSPTRSSITADLIVRLYQGATLIATWTHTGISSTYVDAVQTLTSPQLAAITDFANLFIELDDNNGHVYRVSLGNPSTALTTPVTVSYRYKSAVDALTYTGPGDISSGWQSWHGLRAFSSATAGQPDCRCAALFAQAIAPPLDIYSLADGSFDTASATAFLASTTGKI